MDCLFFYDTELGRVSIGEKKGAIVFLGLPGEEVPKDVPVCET